MRCVRRTLVHVPIKRKLSDGILLEGQIGWCIVYGVHRTVYSVKYTACSVQCTVKFIQCTVNSRIGRPAQGGLGGRHKFLREQAVPRSLIEHCKHFTECTYNMSQIFPKI